MTDDNRLGPLVDEAILSANISGAYRDVLSLILAELALLSNDPIARLSQMKEEDSATTYGSAALVDDPSPSLQRTLKDKAAAKAELFGLAEMTLQRMVRTRK